MRPKNIHPIFFWSTQTCFVDALPSARGAFVSCRGLNPDLGGQRNVGVLAVRMREFVSCI